MKTDDSLLNADEDFVCKVFEKVKAVALDACRNRRYQEIKMIVKIANGRPVVAIMPDGQRLKLITRNDRR